MKLSIIGISILAGLLVLAAEGRAKSTPAASIQCDDFARATIPSQQVPTKPPESLPYHRLSWQDASLNLGIGTIQAERARPFETDWVNQAWLPLADTPGGKPWAWIAKGWLLDLSGGNTDARPLGTGGMLETDYEVPSFIVLEENPEGWLRIRWGLGSAERGGTAWIHPCHLRNEAYPLRFERWESRFLSDQNAPPLFFRSAVRHSLRVGPGTDHARLAWIEGRSYELIPLEVRGDWMRVRYVVPAITCAEPGAEPKEVTDGWTKWRSPDQGSWVYYHTRGC